MSEIDTSASAPTTPAPEADPSAAKPEGAPGHEEQQAAAPNEPDEKAYVETLRKAGLVLRGGKVYASAKHAGKAQEIDLTDPKTMDLLSMGLGGKAAFAERDNARRELNSTIAGLEKALDEDSLGTWAALARSRGQDPDKILGDYMAKQDARRKLSPEQREAQDAKEERDRLKAEKEQRERAEATAAEQQQIRQHFASYAKGIDDAIAAHKLPQSDYVRHAMATMIKVRLDRGESTVDMDAIAKRVGADVGATSLARTKGMTPAELAEALGETGVQALLAHLKSEAEKKANAPPPAPADGERRTAAKVGEDKPRSNGGSRPDWARGSI